MNRVMVYEAKKINNNLADLFIFRAKKIAKNYENSNMLILTNT